MKNNIERIERTIAQAIVLAQVGSDKGKGFIDKMLASGGMTKAVRGGYVAKDFYIIKAVEAIRRSKSTQFHYWVIRDKSRVANFIVYFSFRAPEGKYQVSFHSFDEKLERYTNGPQKCSMRWDRKVSRESCKKLIEMYDL